MPKISVLIPDAESTLTGHVLHCLSRDRDVEVHLLSKDPKSTVRRSRFVKSFNVYDSNIIGEVKPDPGQKVDEETRELIRFHYYDKQREDALVSEILKHASRIGNPVVFPVDEHIVKILSGCQDKIRPKAQLAPLTSREMFTTAIDKWQLSQFLTKHGVPHPATTKLDKTLDQKSLSLLKFPVIAKPINLGNAQGIHSFDSLDALTGFFKNQDVQHEYIVQPFIKGFDIDCSVICNNGEILAYTIQRAIEHSKKKYAAAVGIEFLFHEKVLGVVTQMMKHLNWSGVAHIDLRYDEADDLVKVIEVNGRYWGSLLGSLVAGINFPLLSLKIVKGEEFALPKYEFSRYFMGSAPMKRLLTSMFSSNRIHFRETSFSFSVRDPGPFLTEMSGKIGKKIFG
ncbi:MAG TPA: ATP-grasp domain-containing protein [Cyclobacteriaceae bacterium]|nr:ATP-grasp domain-containing protein [Cyclobacteriaceae bacterium]